MLSMIPEDYIYLDYAATTPLDSRVLQVMLPFFSQDFGNPSSIHRYGQQAEAAVESAREICAQTLNCQPEEIVFTSCGTESDNLALRGTALANRQLRKANHILVSTAEHHAITHTVEQLHHVFGFDVEFLPVDKFGLVDPQELADRIRPDTAIVSIIYGNNEIGTINPISEIGEICHSANVPFHTDAVQASAYLSLDVRQLKVDLLSIGAHKFYGPKGVGALFIRKGTPIFPTQTGGGQEFGMRAGTHNIPYIVGMSEALRNVQSEKEKHSASLTLMRDQLIGQILEDVPQAKLTGHPAQRLPNHASFVFHQIDGNLLLMHLDRAGFACSSGSACKTGNPEPSDVLIALGLSPTWALGSLRVTLGKHTTPTHIDLLCKTLPSIISKLRD